MVSCKREGVRVVMRMYLSAGSMPRASNGQAHFPLVATQFPRREITFPVLPTNKKASLCAGKECFCPGFHHAVEVSEDPEVTHVVRPVLASKPASNWHGGTRGGIVLSDSVHATNSRVLNIRLPTIAGCPPGSVRRDRRGMRPNCAQPDSPSLSDSGQRGWMLPG